MNAVAEIALVVNALVLAVVGPMEMFGLERPAVRRFLGVEMSDVRDAELWSFCIGARNVISALGVALGVWMLHSGREDAGVVVMTVTAAYMLLASLAMGLADLLGKWHPRGGSVVGTIASSVLPALALVVQAA